MMCHSEEWNLVSQLVWSQRTGTWQCWCSSFLASVEHATCHWPVLLRVPFGSFWTHLCFRGFALDSALFFALCSCSFFFILPSHSDLEALQLRLRVLGLDAEISTSATSMPLLRPLLPTDPGSRAPWGGTPGQGGHGLHLALVLLLELQCFGLGCCLLGEVAAFDVPFLWGNLHIPLLHTFAFSCPTSPSALRWWSWGPGASARWGCPSPPALHGRPWRPRELLRRPGPRRLKRQDYRGPPTPGHSEHHFASPGCFSWTALVSAPHNVVGDAQRQQLQLGLLGPFQSVGWHHCQTCLRCLYLKGPETGNSLSLSRPLCARCHKVYIILY